MESTFKRPTPKAIAAALDILSIANAEELREGALWAGYDGRNSAIKGLLNAAVIVADYQADDTAATAEAYLEGNHDDDCLFPIRTAAEDEIESQRAAVAASLALAALEKMEKLKAEGLAALKVKRFGRREFDAMRERLNNL